MDNLVLTMQAAKCLAQSKQPSEKLGTEIETEIFVWDAWIFSSLVWCV